MLEEANPTLTLVQPPGAGQLDAARLASGTYIYRMIAQPVAGGKEFSSVKKLLLLK